MSFVGDAWDDWGADALDPGGIIKGISGEGAAEAAGQAATAQLQGVRESNALQKEIFEQTRADYKPRLDIQNNALAKLANFNPAEIANDPAYKFNMEQGNQAIERSQAARGLSGSGATLKSLSRYNQGLASQTSGQKFSQLAQLAGLGIDASGATANAGQNYANQVSQGIIGGANARASGYLSAANAQQQGATNVAGLGLAALSYFSDPRLKTNIERIGTHESGLPLYEWDYLWGEHAQGVMADEAKQKFPDAVYEGPFGYLFVRYDQLEPAKWH